MVMLWIAIAVPVVVWIALTCWIARLLSTPEKDRDSYD